MLPDNWPGKPTLKMLDFRFYYHCLRRDISNFSLLRHRDYDGFLVSMHQAGTHWLKHMLATAIACQYQLPPPRYSHANDIIGGVHDRPQAMAAPRLASSHSIPHMLVASPWLRQAMKLPPYVLLVRDMRATLVANYEKWKHHYDCSFPEFLRGDVSGRRFNNDLWWCIRFCNAWGRVLQRFPQDTLLLRYEDLRRDDLAGLQRVNAFLNLGLAREALERGVRESDKENMARKRDPETPAGVTVVRDDPRHFAEWFNEGDRAFFAAVCQRWLRYTFDYHYDDWTTDS